MQYNLTFAGVPFCLDNTEMFRHEHTEANKSISSPLLKYQSETKIIEELDRLCPFMYGRDFNFPSSYPGRNLGLIAKRQDAIKDMPVRIGEWYYPATANRWSVFRGLASSSQVQAMISAVTNSQNNIGIGLFSMCSAPNNATTGYTISTNMYMLPPKPLAEHGGAYDGLYLVTLVDDRYQFQGTPVSLHVEYTTLWADLLEQLSNALNITISYSPVELVYGGPETDSHLWSCWESAAILLDAVAANIGRVVVRNFDGSYSLYTAQESVNIVLTNRGKSSSVIREAGGNFFDSPKVMNINNARNLAVPASLNFVYPKYIIGDDPVPHFFNPRNQNQRSTSWLEDSYGDMHLVNVPISSGGAFVSGLTGISQQTIRDTSKATYNTELTASSGMIPLNSSGLIAQSIQLAKDYYTWQVGFALDETYPGTLFWTPEGIHDIVWSYTATRRQASCRVFHSPWTQIISSFQHTTPPHNRISRDIVRGMGGKSVAQTWIGDYIVSGQIIMSLTQAMQSGDVSVTVGSVDYLPTDERWKGIVEDEIILFEGTSGGLGTSGNYQVGVALRGIDSTFQTDHPSNVALANALNDAYGINLVNFERGQFLYPSVCSSGGIQGVNVIPQVQTVKVLDTVGMQVTSGGTTYYSGSIQYGEPSNPSLSGIWQNGNNVWVIERNQAGLTQEYMEGQFIGYSSSVSGNSTAPIYAVGVGGGGCVGTRTYVDSVCQIPITSGAYSGTMGIKVSYVTEDKASCEVLNRNCVINPANCCLPTSCFPCKPEDIKVPSALYMHLGISFDPSSGPVLINEIVPMTIQDNSNGSVIGIWNGRLGSGSSATVTIRNDHNPIGDTGCTAFLNTNGFSFGLEGPLVASTTCNLGILPGFPSSCELIQSAYYYGTTNPAEITSNFSGNVVKYLYFTTDPISASSGLTLGCLGGFGG